MVSLRLSGGGDKGVKPAGDSQARMLWWWVRPGASLCCLVLSLGAGIQPAGDGHGTSWVEGVAGHP